MNRLTGATLYWDGADTSSAADGGSGLWSATSSVLNWSDAAINGNAAAWSSGDSAVFGALAGIVTLGATHTAGSVRFNVDGYVLDTAGYDLTLSQLDGNGSFTKSGAGALTVTSRGSSYTGKITIDGGVLKLGDIEGVLGAYNTSVDKITVRPGGTFDVAGQYDGQYGATLAGTGSAGQGAMINSGADTGSGHIQTQNIALSDDATIGGSGNFYMIAPGFAPGFLYLNGHTLTKIGANTFGLGNTWVSKGTVRIEAGKISLLRAIGATNTTF